MYGLPEDFDPSFFIGRRLELICFGENTVNLHFDGELHITIESAFIYHAPETDSTGQREEIPVLSSEIMRLIGSSIIDCSASTDGALSLTFENDRRLQILDTSSQYESYRIDYGQMNVIV